MPPEILEWDHEETVKALGDGRIAMITEWSGWYKWLADRKPRRSLIAWGLPLSRQARRKETGPRRLLPGIGARSSPAKQALPGSLSNGSPPRESSRLCTCRRSARTPQRYEDKALKEKYPYFEPLVVSWSIQQRPLPASLPGMGTRFPVLSPRPART